MKKLIMLFVIFSMLVSGVYAEKSGLTLASSLWNMGSGARIVPNPVGGEACVSLRGKNSEGIFRTFNAGGIITIESDFYYTGSGEEMLIPEVRGKTEDGKEVMIAQVKVIENSIAVMYFDGNGDTYLSSDIDANTWHRITIELNTLSDSYCVWIDDTYIAANKLFVSNSDIEVITKISFFAVGASLAGYVNNLNSYFGEARGVSRAIEISSEDIIIDEDFNGKSISMTVDPIIEQKDVKFSDNEDLSMMIPAKSVNKFLSASLNNLRGTVTVEAEILVNEATKQIKIPDLLINGTEQGVLLSVLGSNVSVPYFKDGENIRASKPIVLGEWFKIAIQASTTTNLFTVWVNDAVLIENVPFYNNNKAEYLSVVRFNASNAENPDFYVDNVKIYKGERQVLSKTEPEAKASLLSKSVVMKKDSNIAYMTKYRTKMQVTPFESDGKTYFPISQIAQGFANEYFFDITTDTGHLAYYGDIIRVKAGEKTFEKNKGAVNLPEPLLNVDGQLYATIDAIKVLFDREATYFADSGIAIISHKGTEISDTDEILSEILSLYSEELLPEANLYVDPSGDDSNDGKSIETPLRTIEAAQNLARALVESGEIGDITIHIRKGTYYLEKGLRFNSADSREGNYKTTYKKYDEDTELPLLDGGKRITNWKPYKNGIYVADLPEGVKQISTLYENGNRVEKARHPNSGYSKAKATAAISRDAFHFESGDIPKVSNPLELEIYIWPGGPSGYINWSPVRAAIKSLNYDDYSVYLNKNLTREIGTGSRYFVYNSLDLLDTPGEFYVDVEKNKIYYMPVSTDIKNAVIVAPAQFDLITASGNDEKSISNILFDGLQIRSTDFNKSIFMLTNVENFEIKNCKIYNSGHIGVHVKGKSKNIKVENCEIYQTGFYGVYIEGAKNITTERTCYGHQITNNYIHDIGEMNGNACGIRFAHTQYSIGRHNKIKGSPRNALHIFGAPDQNIIGGVYDGIEATKENSAMFKPAIYNTFEYNEASEVIKDSQDTNAIGAWGAGEKNTIRKNIVHDNYLPQITNSLENSFWFPFYFDERSDNSTVMENITYDNQKEEGGILRSAFLSNASMGANVVNNIFADSTYKRGAITLNDMDGDVRRSKDFTLERNIISNFPGVLYVFQKYEEGYTVKKTDNNLFNSATGKYLITSTVADSLDSWKTVGEQKYDINSIVAPPGFIDEENRDFRLKYDSSAYMIGFEDINQSDIGLRRDYPFADPNDAIDKLFVYREGEYFKKGWASLATGDEIQLNYDIRTKNGYLANNDGVKISLESDNAEVASVDQNGKVTVNGSGRCMITVKAEKNGVVISKGFEIVSDDNKIMELSVIGVPDTVEVNNTVEVRAMGITEMGKKSLLDNFEVQANSENITVSGKTISAKDVGVASISITSADKTIISEFSFSVVPAKLNKISVSTDKEQYIVGEKLIVNKELFDTKGNKMSLEDIVFEYEGDINGVIESKDGELIASKNGMGGIKVIATHKDGTVATDTMTVAVLPSDSEVPQGYKFFNFSRAGTDDTAGYSYTSNGQINIVTSGFDAWDKQDSCSALLKEMNSSDNLTVSAVLDSVTNPVTYGMNGQTAIHAAAGVMIRDNATPESKNIFVRYRLNGDVIMTYRTNDGGTTTYLKSTEKLLKPVEVKITKTGDVFEGFYKNENNDWTTIGKVTVPVSDEIYVGCGSQSGVQGDFNNAVFSSIDITKH
jgi:hypothetical protein